MLLDGAHALGQVPVDMEKLAEAGVDVYVTWSCLVSFGGTPSKMANDGLLSPGACPFLSFNRYATRLCLGLPCSEATQTAYRGVLRCC